MTFTIYYQVPYEGLIDVRCYSIEEVKDWLKNNRSSYDYNLDNVEVRIDSPNLDVYALMREE